MKKLTEIYGIKEGPKYSRDAARMQADVDSATTVARGRVPGEVPSLRGARARMSEPLSGFDLGDLGGFFGGPRAGVGPQSSGVPEPIAAADAGPFHRFAKGTGPRSHSPEDEPLPDLPLEAYGSGAEEIKRALTTGKMDTYACIARAVKLVGTGKDPVEVASALHDVLYGEGSRPQPVRGMGGEETGQSVFASTAGRAVGGLKLQ